MRLRTRLLIGAVGIALVLAIPLLVAVRSLERVHRTTLQLRSGAFAASLLLGRFRASTDQLRHDEDAMMIVHDPASKKRLDDQITSMRLLADSLQRYELAPEATTVRLALDSLSGLTNEEYAKMTSNASDSADMISSQWVQPRIGIIDQTISGAEQSLRVRTRQAVSDATDDTAEAERTAITAMIAALILAGLITLWLIRSISRPVLDLESGMKAVASGKFTHRLNIEPNRQDEFGRLSSSFETMSNRLAQLDKLKAEFISIASHELKTPINVILGYVELLEEGIYGKLNEQQREVTETIATQARNLTRLVRRLLDVSRFEAGGGTLDCRQMNLARFLDSLQASFRVLAMQRGIEFDVDRDANLPGEVRWDEDRMNEVLGNLLSNAFKFTNRGGRVALSIAASDSDIIIRLADTGAGIPADQLPKIFQKFFQADNQSKAASKGSGLGLAIAKEIVEAHGGAIEVTSAVGRGTTFTITMPAKADVRRTGSFRLNRTAA